MTDEETAEVFLSRARLLADLDRWAEAAEELVQARSLEPRHVDVLALSALVAVHEGQSAAALAYAEAAMSAALHEHGPGYEHGPEEALITRAWVLCSVGEQAAALAYAKQLAGEFPNSAYPMLVASALFSVVGGGQQALDTAWSAVQLAPADPDTHWLLSCISGRMGLEELARNSAQEARRLGALPGRRVGVWKLWWQRYGGVDTAPAGSSTSGWIPIVKIAAVVVVIGLLLAWLAAG